MDWRTKLLADVTLPDPDVGGRNPIGWVGYEPRQAVRFGAGRLAGHDVVAVVWDFSVYGGSLGEVEADTFQAAVHHAIVVRRPLVTLVRSGGTRLQEGMAALMGIARTSLALEDLAAAGIPHISVADNPTTGGVWVSVVSGADLRVAVAGATIGFSGPRVTEAITGAAPEPDSHVAESAYAAGLIDAVVGPDDVETWLGRALTAVAPQDRNAAGETGPIISEPGVARRTGADQVRLSRETKRPGGGELLDALLDGAVDLGAADETVRAVIGRSALGRSTVGVALAARRSVLPSPSGYALLARAAQLADRLGADLLTLVDTPGADPRTPSESGGIAPAIHAAFSAVIGCRSASLAIVHGEGGSGGALAAAVADEVLVTDTSYFTALAPEGAAVTLHLTPQDAADRMALTPPDLRALGFADGYAPTHPRVLREVVASRLARLAQAEEWVRIGKRRARWARPLPGRCDR
ncbi:MAG: acyl-CoA carboxylase subunit beta [Frankiales bacterium]|jgi:acetyl-CoA carboxylase carboxyl transferase subunit beta|nr:acyl-CoA carboxylase subunit beta [Frankiales bacterium]